MTTTKSTTRGPRPTNPFLPGSANARAYDAATRRLASDAEALRLAKENARLAAEDAQRRVDRLRAELRTATAAAKRMREIHHVSRDAWLAVVEAER